MESHSTLPPAAPPPSFNPGRIENYYDQVHKASWVRRTAGIFAGATLGIIFGGAIGAIAAFIPFMLGAAALAPPLGAVLLSAAIYAGVGGFMGPVVGTAVGESAGAVAGGLAVREHQEIQANAQQPVIAAQATKDAGPSGPQYFSWRPAAFFGTLCGGFGAMTAATGIPLLQSANTMLFSAAVGGAALTGGAAVAATAIVFGLFGSLMGFKFGRFSNELSNFYTKVLIDNWGEKKDPEPQMAPSVAPAITRQPVAAPIPDIHELPGESRVVLPEKRSLAPEVIASRREVERAVHTGTQLS